MTSHFESTIFKITAQGDTEHRISIEEIAESEREGKEFLGKADGRDIVHCVYLGARHGDRFLERARWYYLSDEEDALLKELRKTQPDTIRVEFYGVKA